MYQIEVGLKGLCPMIQNNPLSSIEVVRESTTPTRVGRKIEEPLKTGYANKTGFFIPARQIEGCMFRAAMKIKLGKSNMSSFIKSCVFSDSQEFNIYRGKKPVTEPDAIYNDPIFKKNGEMVFHPRVMFNEWECRVVLNILEDSIPKDKILEVLTYGGLYVGIGARRPRYGRFMVIK